MSSNNSSSSSNGIGFSGALALLFIALKLLDKIDWSWWWVLAPIWIPLAILIVVLIVVAVVWFINDTRKQRKRKARGW